VAAAGALGFGFVVISLLWPPLAIIGLLVSVAAGQLVRFSLPGQGGGILLSDLAVVVVLATAFVQFLRKPSRSVLISIFLISPFILWTLSGTILAIYTHTLAQAVVILAYWLRLVSVMLLLPAGFILFKKPVNKKIVQYSLSSVAGLVSLVGLLQWWFLPDLTFLAQYGWDPHQGRVVSTWLDPNFVGIFLTMMIPWLIAKRRFYILCLVIPALLLTSSRSSFIALALASVVMSPILLVGLISQSKKAALVISTAVGSLGVALLLLGVIILGPRALSLIRDDPTVDLRVSSLQTAWQVIQEYPWVGVGYNAYQFAVSNDISSVAYTIHSRAGADNSYLTLWATTGLIGLLLCMLPLAGAWLILIRKWFVQYDFMALATALSLLTLLIHANFINSLLYGHILIVLVVMLAYVFSKPV